jgi:hypothetical protein
MVGGVPLQLIHLQGVVVTTVGQGTLYTTGHSAVALLQRVLSAERVPRGSRVVTAQMVHLATRTYRAAHEAQRTAGHGALKWVQIRQFHWKD